MNGKYGLAIILGIVILSGSRGEAEEIDAIWTNPNIGAAGGDWFDPGNWSGGAVPDLSLSAGILNGGEAFALGDSAPGPLQARELHIGTDFNGRIVVRDVDVNIASDLHVARAINAPAGDATMSINGSQIAVGGTFFAGTVAGPVGGFAVANINISASSLDVGDDLIVARSENTLDSFIFTVVSIGGGHTRIGFGSLGSPGNVEVATAVFEPGERGIIEAGALIVPFSQFEVAGDIVVGRLAGGSAEMSNVGGSIQGRSSHITANNVRLGQRVDDTAGAVSGSIFLDRSLVEVAGELQLSENSRLQFTIPGIVRADGTGGADHYSAINSAVASLAGQLTVDTTDTYSDPLSAGTIDTFRLVVAESGGSGSFDVIRYDGVPLAPDFGSRASGFRDHIDNGLFRVVQYDKGDVVLHNYRALAGDANGDGIVDAQDFNIWNDNKFTNGTDWLTADFNGDGFTDGRDLLIWNVNKFTQVGGIVTVPEMGTGVLSFVALLGLAVLRQAWTKPVRQLGKKPGTTSSPFLPSSSIISLLPIA